LECLIVPRVLVALSPVSIDKEARTNGLFSYQFG
jgi:hypothetical protein